MAKGLDKQVYIYSVDTSAFYNKKEAFIHNLMMRYLIHKKKLNKSEKIKIKLINKRVNELKKNLRKEFNLNRNVRRLNQDNLKDSNVISIFESSLSRTIGAKENTITMDIITIRAYHYKVLNDLISDGFDYNGEHYVYFSSSAGQIRTKKGVFIKESVWLKHKDSLTCGLSVEEINSKGGSNVNKYLSYLALTNSATNEWKGFNIDKAIVVPDLATDVYSEVDYINRDTYEITRQTMDIEIEHTDGCGMILPSKSKKSFMCRLPFLKGLLVPFDFKKFSSLDDSSTKVIDIYNKEWDIVEDDIQIIFTKSQFKMWKYYEDWDDYKSRFKQHKCQAAKLNVEDTSNDAMLNYQMLQTLTDITDEELEKISSSTIDDILSVGSNKETMLRVLGATKHNKNKNYFQGGLYIYPELLNDAHAKQTIKDKKKSMVRDARAGKLNINGKYTFLCPDLYAFCEKLFMAIEEPKGLLHNNEIYCNLFHEGKVDVLRSPHLYREHAIKNNVIDENKTEWFITNGIYTSVLDPISKMLQFDNDGDKALVIQDETFINVAERNMKGIVPLYYEMSKAEAQKINSENIYNSLILAYKANIGEISNNITKIWNSDNVNLDVIKWLCMENNFTIDFAKTLFMPTRPKHVDEKISDYIKDKVPHFFVYAKDKKKKNVVKINHSTVNKLNRIIPNKRIKYEDIAGTLNPEKLFLDKDIEVDDRIIVTYEEFDRNKDILLRNHESSKHSDSNIYIYDNLRNKLLEINSNINQVADMLIKYLYIEKKSKYKTTLWEAFGDVILKNLQKNLKNTIQCSECGKRVKKINNRSQYCAHCWKEIQRKQTRERVREYRFKKSVTV